MESLEDTPFFSGKDGSVIARRIFLILFVILVVVLAFSIAAIILASKAIDNNNSDSVSSCYYSASSQQLNGGNLLQSIHVAAVNAIVIRNGNVWTGVLGATVAQVDILVENGTITKIGESLPVPEGTTEFDVKGAFVTPGIVDMHSHLGVGAYPNDAFGTDDTNEATNPDTPQVRVIDALDPNDPAIPLIVTGGVTTSLVLPGSANLIGGEALHVKLKGGTVANMTIPGAPRAFKMATGENPKRTYGQERGVLPSTRMGVAWGFRRVFADAAAHKAEQDQWDCIAKLGTKQQQSRPYNAQLEPLVAILRNQALVNVHCYEVQDFEMVLRVADEFGFQVAAFHHALEAYKIPYIFAPRNITIATFADMWGFKMEAYDASVFAPSILRQNGVNVALKSDHSVLFAKHLITEAVKAFHYGLGVDDALRAVTAVPAVAIGLGDKVGTLEVGKDGDIVVWDRHPLVIGARPTLVFIEGVLHVDSPLPDGIAPSTAPPTFSNEVITVNPNFECIKDSQPQNISSYAIKGVTLWTMESEQPLYDSNLIVVNGIVSCIGPTCSTPDGAYEIQLSGGFVIPGVISASSTVGLSEVEQEENSWDGIADGVDNSAIHAADGIRLYSKHVSALWGGGVTTQIAKPMGDALIAGVSAAFYTRGKIARDAVYNRIVALHVNIGNWAKSSGITGSVSGQFSALREIFTAARQSEDLESPIYRAINGTLPIVFRVDQADEMGSVIQFKDDFSLQNVVILGGAEASVIATELAAAGVSVILSPVLTQPYYFETLRATDDNFGILHAAGVKVAIAEEDPGYARNLRWQAGYVLNNIGVKYNISQYDALSAITSSVADIFDLPYGVGRISTGNQANFVLYDGNPLVTGSKVSLVGLGGFVQCYPQPL